eukprot:gene15819-biopygen9745
MATTMTICDAPCTGLYGASHIVTYERGQREVSFWVPTGERRTEVGGVPPPLFFTDGERETETRQRRPCSRPAGGPDV